MANGKGKTHRKNSEICSALSLLIGQKETNLPLIAEVSTESSESPKGRLKPVAEKVKENRPVKGLNRPGHRRPASLCMSPASIVVTAIAFSDPRHPARCPVQPSIKPHSKVAHNLKGSFQLSGISFCPHCRSRVSTEVGYSRAVRGARVWVLRCVECLGLISKLS